MNKILIANRWSIPLALLYIACQPAVLLAQTVSQRPFERAADEHFAMLLARDYDELERNALDYREQTSTLSDGQSNLAALYGGVAGCMTQGCPSAQSADGWKARYQRLTEWRARYPQSVTAQVAGASYFVEYAWSVRGQGYASTVKPEAWEEFRRNIETARRQLNELGSAAKEDPGWYTAMLDIGLAQGWPLNEI